MQKPFLPLPSTMRAATATKSRAPGWTMLRRAQHRFLRPTVNPDGMLDWWNALKRTLTRASNYWLLLLMKLELKSRVARVPTNTGVKCHLSKTFTVKRYVNNSVTSCNYFTSTFMIMLCWNNTTRVNAMRGWGWKMMLHQVCKMRHLLVSIVNYSLEILNKIHANFRLSVILSDC